MSASDDAPYLPWYPNAELVFGLVCPLGADYQLATRVLETRLEQFGYGTIEVKVSQQFSGILKRLASSFPQMPSTTVERAKWKIRAGNAIRKRSGHDDMLALVAASMIAQHHAAGRTPLPMARAAFVISTLKRKEEVDTLRRLYGQGFYLIGLHASKHEREKFFADRSVTDPRAIADLIETDTSEAADEHGQRTRDAFHLADVFVTMRNVEDQIGRFLDLIFGCPTVTPERSEHAMFMAYASSLRSSDLARQVGAAILNAEGDLISVGCNEVPKFGGGIYASGDDPDYRDLRLGVDSNDDAKYRMMDAVVRALAPGTLRRKTAIRKVKPTGLLDITEYGRSVHAEMEALLACARTGQSVRGATLYTTTLPCHNCTRHIVNAGLARVIYIEPYPKSRGEVLHGREIAIDPESDIGKKIPFEPFIGVGPRRYFDLFSLQLSSGYSIERKTSDGRLKEWSRIEAAPRLQMQPATYLTREKLAAETVKELLSKGASK